MSAEFWMGFWIAANLWMAGWDFWPGDRKPKFAAINLAVATILIGIYLGGNIR